MFKPSYRSSWALVIGIDDYSSEPKLACACNDAIAVSDSLIQRFKFPKENVSLLLDDAATRDGIRSTFAKFADASVEEDDRVFVFFAGHGHTRPTRRGEAGFLVPQDGSTDDLATLIPWKEWLDHADIVVAKHVLFIMDACYGGTAVTRSARPGSSRFLRDMLIRYSRQALTAGKADEPVADSGGPRKGHSVFTGHLLDAFDSGARTKEGVITANSVMAYVYDRVSTDKNSRQTPHFGYVSGDGDFIFEAAELDKPAVESKVEVDLLVQVPAELNAPAAGRDAGVIEQVKEFLPDSRFRIRLDDLVSERTRAAIALLSRELYPTDKPSPHTVPVRERLAGFENAIQELSRIAILLARWGEGEQVSILTALLRRMSEQHTVAGGFEIWIGLRWMPNTILTYSAGIAAIAAERYQVLAAILKNKAGSSQTGSSPKPLFAIEIDELARAHPGLKLLPEHERQFVPISEYLFKNVQPALEDMLSLGSSYEEMFDRFEILRSMTYAANRGTAARSWAPPGRFAWKASQGVGGNPLSKLVAEAEAEAHAWPPVHAGLFGGAAPTFVETAKWFREDLLSKMGFF